MTIKEIRKTMRHYRYGNDGHQILTMLLIITPLIIIALVLLAWFILRTFSWRWFRVILSMLLISGTT